VNDFTVRAWYLLLLLLWRERNPIRKNRGDVGPVWVVEGTARLGSVLVFGLRFSFFGSQARHGTGPLTHYYFLSGGDTP